MKKLYELHYHELLHTSNIIMNLIEEEIINHEASDEYIKDMAMLAQKSLYRIYNYSATKGDDIK